jgi:hypothetical protein
MKESIMVLHQDTPIVRNELTRRRRMIMALAACGLLSVMIVLFVVPPAELPLASCAFHSLTGYGCMTCGMTRSFHALMHGELATAIRYHLMGPVVFLLVLLSLVKLTAEAVSGRQAAILSGMKVRLSGVLLLAAVWFVYWVVRLFVG